MKEENKGKNYFELLNSINVSDKTEKKNGLTYLSWAWAWTEVKKLFPDATYNIKKFGENNLPYVYDEKTGYMVFTDMTIEGITHEMWLCVMDGSNQAMKDHPYTYQVKKYEWNNQTRKKEWLGNYEEKTVEAATMFDINKTIMRCLTKNIAMFGLGLYIYAGEDLPEGEENPIDIEKIVPKKAEPKTVSKATESQIKIIKERLNEEQIKVALDLVKKQKLEDLTVVEASSLLKKLGGEK